MTWCATLVIFFAKIISPVFVFFLLSSGFFSDFLTSNIHNKYSISSHLRQGLCTFFWSQKFEFLMYLKTRVFLEEKNIIIWQTLWISIWIIILNYRLQKSVQRPCLKWLDVLHSYIFWKNHFSRFSAFFVFLRVFFPIFFSSNITSIAYQVT